MGNVGKDLYINCITVSRVSMNFLNLQGVANTRRTMDFTHVQQGAW